MIAIFSPESAPTAISGLVGTANTLCVPPLGRLKLMTGLAHFTHRKQLVCHL